MYRQVISNGKTPEKFLGEAYRAGDDDEFGYRHGSFENVPHNTVHIWTGDGNRPNRENMGVFYSAARDPIFYSHHSNVDRMWSIWKTLLDGRDFNDSDWLQSGFLFYDENKNLVRVKVEDCLDTARLGYVYQDVDIPWLESKPTPRTARKSDQDGNKIMLFNNSRNYDVMFPLTLDDAVVSVMVKRPNRLMMKQDQKEGGVVEEVLVIEGIEFDNNRYVKFDVIINDEDDKLVNAGNTEFAGSFVSVPHSHSKSMRMKTSLGLALTDLLKDLHVEDDDDTLIVTLVPKNGKGIKIQGIKINLED